MEGESKYRSRDNCYLLHKPLVGFDQPNAPDAGLEITAGQRTMSGLIGDLTGQTFVLPVMLTGQNSIVLKMK